MPALDDVTQRFIADTAEYTAALKEAADVAYEFAVANATATKEVQQLEAACITAAAAVNTLGSAEGEAAGQTGVFGQMLISLRDIQADSYRNGILLAQIFELLNDRLTALAINAGITANATRNLGNQFTSAAVKAVALAAAQGLIGDTGTKAAVGGSKIFSWVRTAIGFWDTWKNVIHWAVMGTLEILSTAIPALVALGVAVSAMFPTVENLKDHFSNLMIAAGGLHGAIGSMGGPVQLLAGNMQKLNLAVAPDVWMIFGSAVRIAVGHMGAFTSIAQQASNVLGSFSAKIVSDLQGQAGKILTGFFQNAVGYMVEWGQVLGNFFDDFMRIMHDMPGVGAVFLTMLNDIAKGLGYIISIPGVGTIIGLAAAFSALYRYVTFAAGAMMVLFRITGINLAITAIKDFVIAVQVAATQDTLWGATMLVLSGELDALKAALITTYGAFLPFALLLAGGAIIAGLVILINKLTETQSAAQQMVTALENLPQTAVNIAENINLMSLALETETQQMHQNVNMVSATRGQILAHAQAQQNAAASAKVYTDGITKEYNSMKSLQSGLQALGYTNQQTNQDMTILGISIGLQDSKVQQLNQAWGQYLGLIVGGESSLANFATTIGNMLTVTATTGIGNLGRDAGTMTLSITDFQNALKAGPFGSPSGAAAWQNFSQLFTGSAQQIADWARTAKIAGAITGTQFKSVILDTAEIMSQFTGSTGAAADAVLAFARQGDPTITSMTALDKATGGVKKAQDDLNGSLYQGSINMSNAQQIAKNLSAVFDTQLTNAIVSAALKTSGFDTDIQNMMQAQQTGAKVGGLSWQQWAAQATLAMNNALATAQTDTTGITGAWNKVPKTWTTVYTIQGQVVGLPPGVSPNNIGRILQQHGGVVGYQGGGMVGGTSGVDAVHAMLTAGEAVLNAGAVAALGGPLGVHTLNNKPSEAVLTSGMGGGGGGLVLQNHITVELDGRQLSSAWRVNQLTYDRRNPTPNTSLNRPGRPG